MPKVLAPLAVIHIRLQLGVSHEALIFTSEIALLVALLAIGSSLSVWSGHQILHCTAYTQWSARRIIARKVPINRPKHHQAFTRYSSVDEDP
jgi:hypothetical protein